MHPHAHIDIHEYTKFKEQQQKKKLKEGNHMYEAEINRTEGRRPYIYKCWKSLELFFQPSIDEAVCK